MHNHPLHRIVRVECVCCHVAHEFTFTSPSDHVICKGCKRHQGDTQAKASLRDSDHVSLWRSEVDLERERGNNEVQRLRGALEERNLEMKRLQTMVEDLRVTVREGVENAPLPAVEQWWTNTQVAQAEAKRDHAYRSRDHAYQVLWAVNRLHHPDEARDGYCVCHRRTDKCKELAALEPEVCSLARWEQSQIDRFRRGQSHGLPDKHPEVLKRRGCRPRRV